MSLAPDISALTLNDPDPIDWEKGYKDQGNYTRPPIEGKYTLQVPSRLVVLKDSTGERDAITVTADKLGKLTAILDGLIIVNSSVPGANGQKLGRKWVDTKINPYRNGTSMMDFLRGFGVTGTPKTNQEYVALLGSVAGKTLEAVTQWDARCEDCDEKKSCYVGMESFPRGAQGPDGQPGEILAIAPCKHCKKDLFARLKIKKFVSKVTTATPVASNQPVMA